MKKNLLKFVLIVLTLSFLVGYITTSKAIEMPADPNEPGFGIERTAQGNTITLIIYEQALPFNEIILIAEKLPEGVNYIAGSASVIPFYNDGTLIAWLFAKTIPQQLGERTITNRIPATITYQTSLATSNTGIKGKWAVKELSTEGDIISPGCERDCTGRECGSDGCGGSCGSCQSGYTCSNGQCGSGGATIMDVLNGITQYKAGTISIMQLLNIIGQYKQGL